MGNQKVFWVPAEKCWCIRTNWILAHEGLFQKVWLCVYGLNIETVSDTFITTEYAYSCSKFNNFHTSPQDLDISLIMWVWSPASFPFVVEESCQNYCTSLIVISLKCEATYECLSLTCQPRNVYTAHTALLHYTLWRHWAAHPNRSWQLQVKMSARWD